MTITEDDNTTLVNGSQILELARRCPLLLPDDRNEPISAHSPKNEEKGFKLKQLYALLNCSTIETINLGDTGMIFIIDEDSKFNADNKLNELATAIWYEHVPAAAGVDCLVGTVLLCETSLLK